MKTTCWSVGSAVDCTNTFYADKQLVYELEFMSPLYLEEFKKLNNARWPSR
jgi:hypothetical protein